MRLAYAVISLALLALSACSDDTPIPTQQPGQTPAPTPTTSSPPANQPTYSFVQSTILTPHCNSCHSGENPSAGLDFTTWENLVHNPVRSDLVVPGQPKESALFVDGQNQVSLSAEQTQALFDWIQAGALNN